MDSPVLTIAIPTYNRSEKLKATLSRLLPQITSACELLILDNASSPDAASVLATVEPGQFGVQCRIIRNAYNIGSSANLLRCFETALGDWVWVLGDDDAPLEDAVRTGLDHIRDYGDAVFLNFQSELCEPARQSDQFPQVLDGLDALIDGCDSFANLLFVSSGIYNRRIVAEAIGKAYLYGGTFAPHLSLLFIHLRRHSGKSVLSARALVHHGKPTEGDHWDGWCISVRMTELAGLPLSRASRKKLGRWLKPALQGGFPLRGFFLLALLDRKEELSRQIDDAVLCFRGASLLWGGIEIKSWVFLGGLKVIAMVQPFLGWLGKVTGYAIRHPGVPATDLVSRLLDDRRS